MDGVNTNKPHDFSKISSNAGAQQIVANHYATPGNGTTNPDAHQPIFAKMFMGFVRWIMDSVQVVVIALAIFVVFYLFIVSPHTIDGISMQPNFCNGDLILADKLTPRFKPYEVGDVIVFKYDEANDYIKRIMGVGGDVIKIQGGKVYRNGVVVDEPYLPPGRVTQVQPGDALSEGESYTVPDGKFFMMGDNRPNSTDSRRFLAIDPNVNTIKGRVRFVLWPFKHFRVFDGTVAETATSCQQ